MDNRAALITDEIRELVKQARESQNKINIESGIAVATHADTRWVPTGAGDIRILEYGFQSTCKQPLMIDLHGGGFIFNNADVDEKIILRMRELIPDCKFISIDYPKAPEAPFPAAPDSVYDVVLYYVRHAEELGIDTDRMVIGGHSAGGNLSTVTCIRASQRKEFSFIGQILDYPPLDLATPATEKPDPEGCIPADLATLFDTCYLQGHDPKDPDISPVYAPQDALRVLPEALMIVCGRDSLCNEAKRYAQMLEDAGVPVTLYTYPEEYHGFTYQFSPAAEQAIDRMAAFLKKRIGA